MRPETVNTRTHVAIKICGITNAADAFAAVDAGAEMLGFNFYEGSRRFIEPDAAAAIIQRLRERTTAHCVGVFVDATPEEIREVIAATGLDSVQLHGNETPDDCRALEAMSVIKALRVHSGFDPADACSFPCDTILLDSWHANERGGTGAVFDWEVAAQIRRKVARLILAGGLTPENAAAAIRQVQPDAVDVCSGVEDTPGRKNAQRIREFVAAVRSAALANSSSMAQRST